MNTWRKALRHTQKCAGISENIIYCTLTEAELDAEFDKGYGEPFTAWGKKYVYFARTSQNMLGTRREISVMKRWNTKEEINELLVS